MRLFGPWQLHVPALLSRQAELGFAEQALFQARQIDDGGERARALAGILSYLQPQSRPEVVTEALRPATEIASQEEKARLLALLLPHLTDSDRASVREEALAAARSLPVVDQFTRPVRVLIMADIARNLGKGSGARSSPKF